MMSPRTTAAMVASWTSPSLSSSGGAAIFTCPTCPTLSLFAPVPKLGSVMHVIVLLLWCMQMCGAGRDGSVA